MSAPVALLSILAVVTWGPGCATSRDEAANAAGAKTVPTSTAHHQVERRTLMIGLDVVRIPAGTFPMGSSEGEDDERPVHDVTLTEDFWLGETEVTQRQFAAFVDDTDYVTLAERDGGAKVWAGDSWAVDERASWRTVFAGPARPVTAVAWPDAAAFASWLDDRARDAGVLSMDEFVRLPTEAEWERAARGPSGSDRFAGTGDEGELCKFANVADESAAREGLGRPVFPCDDDVGIGTAPVRSYVANGFGAHDLSGNVWEWTLDRYAPFSADAQVDPRTPTGGMRVMKGGSWSGKLLGVTSSARDGYPPSLRGGAIGFRVAVGAP